MAANAHTAPPRAARAKTSQRSAKKKWADGDLAVMAATTFKAEVEAVAELGPLHELINPAWHNFMGLRIGLHALTMSDVEMAGNAQHEPDETIEIMSEAGAFMMEQADFWTAFAGCCRAAAIRFLIVSARIAIDREPAAGGAA